MKIVTMLGFAADAWILATYALLAHKGSTRPFHLANAIGCIPLIVGGVLVGAWAPLVLTAAFGFIGFMGVLRTEWEEDSFGLRMTQRRKEVVLRAIAEARNE